MAVLDTIDTIITSQTVKGAAARFWAGTSIATSGATATSGYTSWVRYPNSFIMPSVGAGINGAYMTQCDLFSYTSATTQLCGLETILGVLTISGNVFSGSATMPTKSYRIEGATTSIQTAARECFIVITTTLAATTPTITITYTNQAGVGSRTATMTLPTNAIINSAFSITPHLQSGDTGIQTITNISTSAGTNGVLKIIGVLPLAISHCTNYATSPSNSAIDLLVNPFDMPLLVTGDSIGFYRSGSTGVQQMFSTFTLTADY